MSRPAVFAQASDARRRGRASGRRLAARAWALVAGLLVACGDPGADDGPADPGGESWPLHVETPGVLGYAALRAPAEQLARQLDDEFGWRPAGLSDEHPLLLLALDPSVLGGDMGFVLPVSDAQAFERSLVESPVVDVVGDRRFHLRLPPDHALAKAQRAFMGMDESGASPGALIEAFTSQKEFVIVLHLRFEGPWAVLGPSFEAGVVAARVLAEVPGVLRDEPETLVLSVDAERIVDTYHEQIEGAKAQVRSLLLGTQLGGFAGAMMNAARNRGGEQEMADRLPVNGEFLWTLVGMLRLGDVHGLQLSTRRLDAFELLSDPAASLSGWTGGGVDGAEAGDLPPGDCDVRLAFREGSDWRGLIDALRPAPELPGARLALSAEPDAFAEALARWARPLVEFVHGEGVPAERALVELADLVRPWDGLVTVLEDRDGQPVLGLATRGAFDAEGAGAWLDDVADAASWDGARPWSSAGSAVTSPGAAAAGDPAAGADGLLPTGWEWLSFDDVLLLSDGRAAAEHQLVVERVREGRDAWADPEGAALWLRLGDDAPAQGLRAADDELVLQLRWGAPSAADASPPR